MMDNLFYLARFDEFTKAYIDRVVADRSVEKFSRYRVLVSILAGGSFVIASAMYALVHEFDAPVIIPLTVFAVSGVFWTIFDAEIRENSNTVKLMDQIMRELRESRDANHHGSAA